jgi:DNA-binding PadR family transcriptional regulator
VSSKKATAKYCLAEIEKAIEKLVERGLVRDTGRRRNGRIVWATTEVGRNISGENLDRWLDDETGKDRLKN